MTQNEALDIMKMGHSVFLTGAAGTGKTFVLNQYIEYLKSHDVSPAITASTGIASTHIGGQTIHSWSGIGILDKLDRYALDKLEQNEKLFKRYENIKVLIIDEISMLHSSRLDMINTLFKKFRHSDKPFAGVQIIFCGDFFQLPPVVRNSSSNFESDKEFAYHSNAWKDLNPVICYLEENYRQDDEHLLKILNNIRFERDIESVFKTLQNKINPFSLAGQQDSFPKGSHNTNFPYNPKLSETAKEKRKDMTDSEKKFWYLINKDTTGYDFTRQKIIKSFILDFYCHELLLGIEIDGKVHDKKEIEDKERQNLLENLGIKIIRFKNEEIKSLSILKLKNIFDERKSELMASLGEADFAKAKSEGVIRLYTHNIDVDSINQEEYDLINGKEEHTYEMYEKGKKNLVDTLKNNCLAPEILNLKIGTKVIFVRNDINKEYQNGTLGEVVDFDSSGLPIVETFNKKRIGTDRESWQAVNDDGKILAEISQIPLRYAWAITVHKSQGMTLDAAEIDLAKAFGSGMGYVALSRVRKFENIKLLGIHNDALKINKDVVRQDRLFREKSDRASTALEKYYADNEMKKKLKKKQEDFIVLCEGSLVAHKVEKEEYQEKVKVKTTLVTLEFVKNEILPKDIAEKRNLTLGTIVGHIEELFEARELKEKDIKYILKDIEKRYSASDLKKIKKVLKEDTGLKIKHSKLNNKEKINIDFHTLKLLRLEI